MFPSAIEPIYLTFIFVAALGSLVITLDMILCICRPNGHLETIYASRTGFSDLFILAHASSGVILGGAGLGGGVISNIVRARLWLRTVEQKDGFVLKPQQSRFF